MTGIHQLLFSNFAGGASIPDEIEFLVVAGGGGGGSAYAGGGGAGGLRSSTLSGNFVPVAGTAYTVTVGAGGATANHGGGAYTGTTNSGGA